MLAIERRNAILLKLAAEGKVLVNDLSREFDVTEETIRRDLEKLDNDGLLQKTYGGAVKVDNTSLDLPFQVRRHKNVEAKQKIAAKIAAMIDDGAHLMFDSSSTALSLIQYIINRKNITLITNSIEILLELCNKQDWNIISTGGTLKEGGRSLIGYQAEKSLADFHVDLAVCSCKGIDLSSGITDSNEADAAIKNMIFESATKKILAVDSTKFDCVSFVKVSNLTNVDMIVTDSEPDSKWINYCNDNGIELVYDKPILEGNK